MKRTRISTSVMCGLAAAIMVPGAASAQSIGEQGPLIYSPPAVFVQPVSRAEAPSPVDARTIEVVQKYSNAQANAGMEKYVDCIIKSKATRKVVERLVRTAPGSPPFADAGKLVVSSCVPYQGGDGTTGVQLVIKNEAMRLAAFGALFRSDFGPDAPTDFADVPQLSLSAEFDVPVDQLSPTFRAYRALGDCIARSAPQSVRDLMFTTPGSAEEKAQFAKIIPAMQGCLTVDQKVALGKYELRGYLAQAAYQLEKARTGHVSSVGKPQ